MAQCVVVIYDEQSFDWLLAVKMLYQKCISNFKILRAARWALDGRGAAARAPARPPAGRCWPLQRPARHAAAAPFIKLLWAIVSLILQDETNAVKNYQSKNHLMFLGYFRSLQPIPRQTVNFCHSTAVPDYSRPHPLLATASPAIALRQLYHHGTCRRSGSTAAKMRHGYPLTACF